MVKRKGGAWYNPTTWFSSNGAAAAAAAAQGIPLPQSTWDWRSALVISIAVIIVLTIVSVVTYFALKPKEESPDSPKKSGGSVAPPYSKLPGRINIAEVAQAPSAGQGIIYFSQSEEQGILCDTCTAEFNINITYTGGTPQPPPKYQVVTSPSLSGVARFDYSVSTGNDGTTPPLPTPPTSMQIDVTARSTNSSGKAGAPTTFSKTLPYIA